MAEVHGHCQEQPPRVIDAAERRMGDEIEALLPTVVGMGAPAHVRDQAGGVTQTAFLGCLGWPWLGEQRVRPCGELAAVLGRARAKSGKVLTEAEQRILVPLVFRKQVQ